MHLDYLLYLVNNFASADPFTKVYGLNKVVKVRGHVHVDEVTASRNTHSACDVGKPLNSGPDFAPCCG